MRLIRSLMIIVVVVILPQLLLCRLAPIITSAWADITDMVIRIR